MHVWYDCWFYFIESLIDIVKHEHGHFDAESILFLDLNSRSRINQSFTIILNIISIDLTDANSLSVCRNIIILNLNDNNLTNVHGFGTLIQLKILTLAQNQINSLGTIDWLFFF